MVRKPMDRKLIGILATSVVVMGLTAWATSPKAPPLIKKEDRHFMHCWKCNKEMPYIPDRFEKPCPQCEYAGGMVATKESLAKTGPPPSLYAAMFIPVVIEANLLLAALLGYAIWKRKKRGEEEYLYTECGHCTQRLRYRAEKIGAGGQCPRCKYSLIFPARDHDEEALPWWQPRRWRKGSKTLWGRLREKARVRFARKVAAQPEDQEK
jgi:DNA-directed RNA polymerase subunit RPC12/RpoP